MAVRGDEVASAIDAHVRESIEKMVSEIRSSIEDVREVVDQQLKAALQSVQADVNSVTFLPHIQKSVGELEQTLGASRQAALVADASRLKRAVQVVERGKSQVDVLNALLEQCLEFGSRAALLILRGETFSGWKGVGFSNHGGNDEMIKRFNAAPGLIPQLDEVLRHERVIEWDGANLSTRFGVEASTKAVLVPMVIKDKVAAAVYVDVIADEAARLDGSSIELLVFMTGLLVDTLAIRKKSPSPSLSDTTGAGTTRGESTAPGMASARQASAPMPPAAPPAPRARAGRSAATSGSASAEPRGGEPRIDGRIQRTADSRNDVRPGSGKTCVCSAAAAGRAPSAAAAPCPCACSGTGTGRSGCRGRRDRRSRGTGHHAIHPSPGCGAPRRSECRSDR